MRKLSVAQSCRTRCSWTDCNSSCIQAGGSVEPQPLEYVLVVMLLREKRTNKALSVVTLSTRSCEARTSLDLLAQRICTLIVRHLSSSSSSSSMSSAAPAAQYVQAEYLRAYAKKYNDRVGVKSGRRKERL